MKSAFYIMEMWRPGNVGSHNIRKLLENPEEGFSNYNEAKHAMLKLKEDGNWNLNQKFGYSFTIMEVFSNG